MSKEDLEQIKNVVEAVVDAKIEEKVIPRFKRIDEKLEEHDMLFEAIIFTLDRHSERLDVIENDIVELKADVSELKADMKEVKGDIRVIKADIRTIKSGQQTHEIRFDQIEEKVFA